MTDSKEKILEEEIKEEILEDGKKKFSWIKNKMKIFSIIAIIVIIACIGGFYVGINKNKNTLEVATEPIIAVSSERGTLDSKTVLAALSESSELTTMKLNVSAVGTFSEDDGIIFLNKSKFTMSYRANVEAGINMNDIEVYVDNENKLIKLIIPKATIQAANVDPTTIEYYDERFVLMETKEKENANAAQFLAQSLAQEEAKKSGILELADDKSTIIVKGLLSGVVPNDYTFEIQRK